MARRWILPVLLALSFIFSLAIPRWGWLNDYNQLILIYIGINIILTVSLNLVNGYMGEFSVGHAGLMAVGAYVSALLSVRVVPPELAARLFPLIVTAGGLAAALVGMLIAIPSFKTRGDYLAIVTLAFNMIVKSVIENIDAVGGPRGAPTWRGSRRATRSSAAPRWGWSLKERCVPSSLGRWPWTAPTSMGEGR
jgi:branched-chain amino acid transport system permease protein